MKVTTPPEQCIDEADGAPVKYIEPDNSRFESIVIKQLADSIEVKAKDANTGRMTEFTATVRDSKLRSVTVDDGRRRDIDDDLQDVLTLVGYTLVDADIQQF